MKQKPLTYTFYYWGAFVLDPCMIYKTKSYLFLKICLKIDVNIFNTQICTAELKKLSPFKG